jgi:hypothetical protein
MLYFEFAALAGIFYLVDMAYRIWMARAPGLMMWPFLLALLLTAATAFSFGVEERRRLRQRAQLLGRRE